MITFYFNELHIDNLYENQYYLLYQTSCENEILNNDNAILLKYIPSYNIISDLYGYTYQIEFNVINIFTYNDRWSILSDRHPDIYTATQDLLQLNFKNNLITCNLIHIGDNYNFDTNTHNFINSDYLIKNYNKHITNMIWTSNTCTPRENLNQLTWTGNINTSPK